MYWWVGHGSAKAQVENEKRPGRHQAPSAEGPVLLGGGEALRGCRIENEEVVDHLRTPQTRNHGPGAASVESFVPERVADSSRPPFSNASAFWRMRRGRIENEDENEEEDHLRWAGAALTAVRFERLAA